MLNRLKAVVAGVVVGITVLIMFTVLAPYRLVVVLSDSMEPTLMVGDRAIFRETKEFGRGDIILFYKTFYNNGYENITLPLTKRVTAVEGDHLISNGKMLLRNGEPIRPSSAILDVIVPKGTVFVLGDNKGSSYDSLSWYKPFVVVEDAVGVICRRF